MLSCCLKCRKNTENEPRTVRTKNGRIMLLSKYAVFDNKITKFINEQRASGILSSLGIKTPLSKIPLLLQVNTIYKMNEIVNKFLLAGDKFMLEMHLRQPGFP